MEIMNTQNDLIKKINKLNQQVQEVDEKGNQKSSRAAPVIDQEIEPRLEKRIDTKCSSLDQKIKTLEGRIDDLSDQITKYILLINLSPFQICINKYLRINNESVMNTSQINSQSNKKSKIVFLSLQRARERKGS